MMIINEFEELTVPKVICPPMSVLAFLNSGNKDIHGGHHGAKKSMNTPELLLLQQKMKITNNLSQLNLQILHDLIQRKKYFHLRISGKSSPVKVSIV